MRKNVFFQNLEIWIWDIIEKTHTYIFIQVSKQRKRKNIKKRVCRVVFRTMQNIYDGAFLGLLRN